MFNFMNFINYQGIPRILNIEINISRIALITWEDNGLHKDVSVQGSVT